MLQSTGIRQELKEIDGQICKSVCLTKLNPHLTISLDFPRGKGSSLSVKSPSPKNPYEKSWPFIFSRPQFHKGQMQRALVTENRQYFL